MVNTQCSVASGVVVLLLDVSFRLIWSGCYDIWRIQCWSFDPTLGHVADPDWIIGSFVLAYGDPVCIVQDADILYWSIVLPYFLSLGLIKCGPMFRQTYSLIRWVTWTYGLVDWCQRFQNAELDCIDCNWLLSIFLSGVCLCRSAALCLQLLNLLIACQPTNWLKVCVSFKLVDLTGLVVES